MVFFDFLLVGSLLSLDWDWMDGSFYIWVRVGWRRRDLWLTGVTFFYLGFLFWFFILVSSLFESRVFLFSWDLVHRIFFFLEQSSWSSCSCYALLGCVDSRSASASFYLFYFPTPFFATCHSSFTLVVRSIALAGWHCGRPHACLACPSI